jgi:DNA-binding NarL/FixJ family response regulator
MLWHISPRKGASPIAGRGADVGVLVVDDQEFFRGVLRDLVSATPGFTVVGEADCGEDALRATDRLSPELVLMDMRMPGCGGIQAARLLRQRHRSVVVLLVSAHEPPASAASELADAKVSFVSKRDLGGAVLSEVWKRREVSA